MIKYGKETKMDLNILITGAGLLGCYTAREVTARGGKVVLYDNTPDYNYVNYVAGNVPIVAGDIRDMPTLIGIMRTHRVNTVFHSAAVFGAKLDEYPYTGLGINIGGTIALAEASRLTGVRRFVFASTGVYNWSLPMSAPVSEDFSIGGDSFYIGSKVACEQVLRAYASKYGFETAMLRFARIYGMGHYKGGSVGGPVLHQVILAASKGNPVHIDSSLFGIDEYLYVNDAAEAVVLACDKALRSNTFNIGTGILSGPEDLAAAIKTVCPETTVTVQVSPDDNPPGFYPDYSHRLYPMDLNRAKLELGYNPRFDLVKGIKHFVNELGCSLPKCDS
jgi:UDP-glucose 4-epimerase